LRQSFAALFADEVYDPLEALRAEQDAA
jgi:hypothetical protein